jgi:dihydroorotate dehydrogenase (NAD+) catalytic subunit
MNFNTCIGGLRFKNPVWVASGTFGYGNEFEDFANLDEVGAIVTKTITLDARKGNPPPRLIETASGMLNSIGLQNKGANIFKREHYGRLKQLNTQVIISFAGKNEAEFVECAKILTDQDFPNAFELNFSCPNVVHGQTKYRLVSQDLQATAQIISQIKHVTHLPLIVKLTPNVTDIVGIAKAAEAAGADAISLINTYIGMAVDAETMKPVLGNVIGGLSGPAIKPLALRAVWEVCKNVSIPVIGIGGIMTGTDVAEFMLCGAKAVQVGTANLVDPNAHTRIFKEFKDYLARKDIQSLDELIGRLKI